MINSLPVVSRVLVDDPVPICKGYDRYTRHTAQFLIRGAAHAIQLGGRIDKFSAN